MNIFSNMTYGEMEEIFNLKDSEFEELKLILLNALNDLSIKRQAYLVAKNQLNNEKKS